MNKLPQILLICWLGCFGSTSRLLGQTATPPDSNCVDLVHLKNGSLFRGKLVEYKPGESLTLKTSTGLLLWFEDKKVRKIVQDCPKVRPAKTRIARSYSFRERGIYNATRLGVLLGDAYWGGSATGAFLQHSTGWQFSRMLGAGIGLGAENFMLDNEDAATYPVFAEMRGYFFSRRVSPYFSLAGGYAFAGKVRTDPDNWSNKITDDWRGGLMARGNLGYRFGNHFTLDIGIRLQRKTRLWTARWGSNETGSDRILHKRLEVSAGFLF